MRDVIGGLDNWQHWKESHLPTLCGGGIKMNTPKYHSNKMEVWEQGST